MYRDLGKVRTNQCRECGKQWEAPAKGQPPAYCSDRCRTEHNKRSVPCCVEGCDKQGSKRDAMCSMHRARLRNNGNLEGTTPKICAHCGGPWVKSPTQETKRFKYCSDECYGAAMKIKEREAKERSKEYRRWLQLEKRYKLNRESYEQMYAEQDGKCLICKKRPDRLFVDHDHSCCPTSQSEQETCGECVRGLLCWNCNAGLGQFQDDPARLSAAIRYLNAPPLRLRFISPPRR